MHSRLERYNRFSVFFSFFEFSKTHIKQPVFRKNLESQICGYFPSLMSDIQKSNTSKNPSKLIYFRRFTMMESETVNASGEPVNPAPSASNAEGNANTAETNKPAAAQAEEGIGVSDIFSVNKPKDIRDGLGNGLSNVIKGIESI
jgi:hypothetical protein